jgi:hypothetical protein
MFRCWWVFITFHEFCIFVWVSGLRMLIADLGYCFGLRMLHYGCLMIFVRDGVSFFGLLFKFNVEHCLV